MGFLLSDCFEEQGLPDLVALGELLHPSPVFSPVTAEGQGDLVERTPVMHTRHSLDLAHPRRSCVE